MPVRVSDLAKERRDLTVDIGLLGQVKLTYRPNVRTPADEAALANSKGEDVYREILLGMEQMIVDWDITGPVFNKVDGAVLVEEDVPVPVQKEILQHISSTLMSDIFQAILEDMRPKSKESTSSKNSRDLYAKGSFN